MQSEMLLIELRNEQLTQSNDSLHLVIVTYDSVPNKQNILAPNCVYELQFDNICYIPMLHRVGVCVPPTDTNVCAFASLRFHFIAECPSSWLQS